MEKFDPFEARMSDEVLEEYLLICQEIFLERQREGSWPWPDSPNAEDLLESEDT
jgi:hypothetical protein